MGRKVDARLPEKRGYPGAVGCSGQGAARCTVPPMVTHTRVPHVHLSAHALPSPRRSRAMTSSQYTPPAQGNPAQRGAPQPGRAVRQPRVLPSPPRPPRRSTQAPARRQPAGSRSNYQLGWEPGPRASTTAPHLNSVGPRSGGVGAAACRGDTAGPPPPTAAPMNRSCGSSRHSGGSHHPSSPLHMQPPGVPQHLRHPHAPPDSAPQSAHRCRELPGPQPSSVYGAGGQHLQLQPRNKSSMQHTEPCPTPGRGVCGACSPQHSARVPTHLHGSVRTRSGRCRSVARGKPALGGRRWGLRGGWGPPSPGCHSGSSP